MNITVVALGKIGLPLAVQFATKGHQVRGTDVSQRVVDLVNQGVEPFPGEAFLGEKLAEVVASGNLVASTDTTSAVRESEAVVIVVPLFVDERGVPDFAWMDAATEAVGAGLQPGTLVSYETTLPVGTTRTRFAPMLERLSGMRAGEDFHVVFSPERVFTGRVFADLRRYPKLVGGIDARSAEHGVSFYESVLDFDPREDLARPNGVWDLGSAEASEMAKLAETTYRDVNIGLANQFAQFAAAHDIDVFAVIDASNSQPYSHIHQPGIAVGGHCIPIYPRMYLWNHPEATVVEAAREANAAMPAYAVDVLQNAYGDLAGATVVVLGASYRGGVKETAFSGVFPTVAALEARGARVLVHDVMYDDDELKVLGFTAYHFGDDADAVIVQTNHDDYRTRAAADVPGAKVIVDGRRITDPSLWEGVHRIVLGVAYVPSALDGLGLNGVVTTPWYPVAHNAMLGSYVVDHARITASLIGPVGVVHADEWPGGTPERVAADRAATERIWALARERGALPVSDRAGARFQVPVPITTGHSVVQRAEAAVDALAHAVGPEWDLAIAHGHIGYLGGLFAARLSSAQTRVFVTEHSTGLADFFAEPGGVEQYREVLERCERLVCVGRVLREQVVAQFPDFADRVGVLPNPVDFDAIAMRSERPTALDRWVCVGGLIERKGVRRLLEAFAVVAQRSPAARLCLIGDGALRPELEGRAAELGVGDRVEFAGTVPHARVLQMLADYDLMVHLSEHETFGIAVVEGVAAGLPVIATRSGGSDETLEELAGREAELVSTGASVEEVVAAYEALSERLNDIDPARARSMVRARYGAEAVRRAVATLYGLAPTDPATAPVEAPDLSVVSPPPALPAVALIATTGWRRYGVARDAQTARQAGLPITLVTADTGLANEVEETAVSPAEVPQLVAQVVDAEPDGRSLRRGLLRRSKSESSADLSAGKPALPRGTCVVPENPHSFATTVLMLEARPDLRLAFELTPELT